MPTAYETEVLDATRSELASDPLLQSGGISVQEVRLEGAYPNTKVVVSYTRSGSPASKSFLIYNHSYPGSAESPPADTVAAVIATNIAD